MAASETIRERKERLALSLDATRRNLAAQSKDLRSRLNPLRHAARLVRNHPLPAVATTTGAVALLTSLARRWRPRRPRRKSVRKLGLSLAWRLAKPALRLWLLHHARSWLDARHASRHPDSLLGP